jgi:glucan biosynthesis protein C
MMDSATGERTTKIKILIVDDSQQVRHDLGTALGLMEGLEVIGEAADGLEAIHQAKKLKPDVVLMDLRMPRMGGLEATRHIKGRHLAQGVIVLTVYGDHSARQRAARAGADAFVEKGTSIQALSRAIQQVCCVGSDRKTNQAYPTEQEPKMTNEKPKKTRMFFVDNLRILLIVLLVLHHLMITYGHSGSWYYLEGQPDDLTSVVATLFTAVNQAFFLGFFFMISGYFTPGSYDRKGPWSFLEDRLLRLGIPLLIYIILIDPLIKYVVVVKAGSFQGSFWQGMARYFGDYRGLGTGPLWFVETLLIFAVLYVLWRLLTKPPVTAAHGEGAKPSNIAIAGFALLLGVLSFIVRIWLPMGWNFVPLNLQFPYFVQYIGLFVFGLIAYRRGWFLGISRGMGRLWLGVAAFCIVVLLPAVFVLGGALEGKVDPFLGGVTWQSFVFSVWEQFVCMGMVIGLLVWFRERLNRQGALAKGLAASAYTVYLIHAPVIVLLALALRGIGVYALLKFVLVAPLAIALCFLIANYLRQLPLARRIL